MSTIVTSGLGRRGADHFEPEAALDPQERRKLKGHLEQIDVTAFEANCAILRKAVGHIDITSFERLAHAAAEARTRWAMTAIKFTESGHAPTAEQGAALHDLRVTYQELAEAYEALRRLVERGYIHFHAKP